MRALDHLRPLQRKLSVKLSRTIVIFVAEMIRKDTHLRSLTIVKAEHQLEFAFQDRPSTNTSTLFIKQPPTVKQLARMYMAIRRIEDEKKDTMTEKEVRFYSFLAKATRLLILAYYGGNYNTLSIENDGSIALGFSTLIPRPSKIAT